MVDRVNGAHVPELSKKTAVHSDLVAPPPPPADSTQTIPTEVLMLCECEAFVYIASE